MYARYLSLRLLLPLAAGLFLALPVPAVALDTVAPPAIVSPVASSLVASKFVITGRVGPSVTGITVTGATTATFALLPAGPEGSAFTAEVTVPYGRTDIYVAATDGITWSAPASLTVWQLGEMTTRYPCVLVDKSDFMLYVVRLGRVIASYPVATGMFGTPTPNGTFFLGRPVHAPSSVWGPFRMRLYRKVWVRKTYIVHVRGHHVRRSRLVRKKVGTSYYIHGTNDPDSIGTRASHGCVRMFNSQLRLLRSITYKYQTTVIRP